VEQNQIEMSSLVQPNAKGVEEGLQALWETARRATEEIARLRREKGILESRLEQLEGKVLEMRQELAKKDEVLRRMNEQQAKLEEMQGGIHVNGDQHVLSAKVKELLAKIDAYL